MAATIFRYVCNAEADSLLRRPDTHRLSPQLDCSPISLRQTEQGLSELSSAGAYQTGEPDNFAAPGNRSRRFISHGTFAA